MKEVHLEFLAYHLDKAKRLQKTGQIFLLGPGASLSGNVSIITGIIQSFLEKNPHHPVLKELSENSREVIHILTCLLPYEREEFLTELNKKLQINDVYEGLAQLMSQGFADYILTVNFDNLVLKALARHGVFPPVHDFMAVHNTTFSFRKGSVIFLHGFHQGPWIPQASKEKYIFFRSLQRLSDTIKGERIWVFLGFQGDEPIFEYLPRLAKFDYGLFWICEKNNFRGVEKLGFLSEAGDHAFLIQETDTGSCMRSLCRLLNIPLGKSPSTAYGQEVENFLIDYVHPERENLKYLKNSSEEDPPHNSHLAEGKQDAFISNGEINTYDYNLNRAFTERVAGLPVGICEMTEKHHIEYTIIHKLDPPDLQVLCRAYNHWGIRVMRQALYDKGENAEKLFREAAEKFHKASILCPQDHITYFNWGMLLNNMGRKISGKGAVHFYLEATEKFKKSFELRPDFYQGYNEFALAIINLADLKGPKEAIPLYQEAINKFSKVIDLNPQFLSASKNIEIVKDKLERIKNKEKRTICREVINTFSGSVKKENFENSDEKSEDYLVPFSFEIHRIHDNMETALSERGTLYSSELSDNGSCNTKNRNNGQNNGQDYQASSQTFYLETIEKLKKVLEYRPNFDIALHCLGIYYKELAKTKNGAECEKMYKKAFEHFKTATEINSRFFDAYFNWGCALTELAQEKKDEKFLVEAVDKFRKAEELNPHFHYAYDDSENGPIYIKDLKKNQTSELPVDSCSSKYSDNINDSIKKTASNWKELLSGLSGRLFRGKKNASEFFPGIVHAAHSEPKSSGIENTSEYEKVITDVSLPDLNKNYDTDKGSHKFYEDELKEKAMAYYKLGSYLSHLARTCAGPEAEGFYRQAFENLQKSYELNGRCYNLACLHAVRGNEREALFFLEKSLSRFEVKADSVKKDKDWANFLKRKDFIDILRRYE